MAENLDEILSGLQSSDESDRCYAVEDLRRISDPKIVTYLVTALEDRSVRVRETAVDVLILVGGPVVAEAAATLLGSENVSLRNAAVEILEKLGPSALDSLEKCMDDSSEDVRKFAIDTIGKILSKSVLSSSTLNSRMFSVLIDRLWSPNQNVAGAAAEALGLAKDDSVIPHLMQHISGPNKSSWLQCNVIVALSRIGSQKSLEAIRQIDKAQLFDEAKTFLEMALNGEVL